MRLARKAPLAAKSAYREDRPSHSELPLPWIPLVHFAAVEDLCISFIAP